MIVLLLDGSHLELVEDVLKEINFNNEDWKQLGHELRVYTTGQSYSYLDNSSILKECLRGWLTSSGATSSFLRIQPVGLSLSLYELADALKSIGYSEAARYIFKTCKLIIMFIIFNQCY